MADPTFRQDAPTSPGLVSILVPVYNSERFLEETVRSLLVQTYRDIEVVLLDDGSTDGSPALAERLKQSDPRIVVLPSHGRNRGVVATRNELLFNARGAFIAWNDSDDVSAPDRIERQVGFLTQNPQFGAVGTGITYADENLVPQRSESYPSDPERQRTDPMLCCATLLAKREAARDAGPLREVFRAGGEDGDWLLKMTDRHAVTNIPDPLYTYRRHGKSLTHSQHNWALTVRLGVMARAAARARREGRPDPVDMLDPDRLLEQLSTSVFLDDPELDRAEILTALSRRLDGEAPALSILLDPSPSEERLAAVITAYEAQSFSSFELLIAAAGDVVPTLAGMTHDAKVPVQIVVFDPNTAEPWEALIAAARGRFLLFAAGNANPPPPWALHGFLELILQADRAETDADVPPKTTRIEIGRDRLRAGTTPGLVLKAEDARGLLAAAESSPTCRGIILHEDATPTRIDNWLMRARAVHRNLGTIGLIKAVGRRAAGKGKSAVGSAARGSLYVVDRGMRAVEHFFYVFLGPRLVRSGPGSAVINSPILAAPKAMLRHMLQKHLKALPSSETALPEVEAQEVAAPPAEVVAPAFEIDFAAAAASATTRVAVYESWGDFPDSLHFLTPSSSACWEKVMFAPAALVENPDFVLVLNTPTQDRVSVTVPPERVWFAIGEPPTETHRPLHRGQGEGTTVITCDMGVPDKEPVERHYIHAPVMTRTWHVKRTLDELASMEQPDKPKVLSWVTSNITLLEGHRRRMAFLEKLRGRVEFDLYGRGFNPIADKWDAIAPYRYSIAFENMSTSLYFTEKIMDCFVCLTLPFYFGDPTIEKFFPKDSMILIDPDDPMVFDRIKDVAASDLWKERQAALVEARDLVLHKYNMYRRLADHFLDAASTEPSRPVEMTIERQVVL